MEKWGGKKGGREKSIGVGRCFDLGERHFCLKFLHNKYRLRNIS